MESRRRSGLVVCRRSLTPDYQTPTPGARRGGCFLVGLLAHFWGISLRSVTTVAILEQTASKASQPARKAIAHARHFLLRTSLHVADDLL